MSALSILENAPLVARSTFRVASSAELLVDIRRPDGVEEMLSMPYVRSQPLVILGEGSNMLFVGRVAGTVATLALPGIKVIHDDGAEARIRVEAGERWDDLVRWSVGRGFHGLENLALIPGSVGACPIQNIGAYGCEVSEFIVAVEAFDRVRRQWVSLDKEQCQFGYRDSLFKLEPERWVITAVEFQLGRNRELRLEYAGIKESLQSMGVAKPRPPHVAEAVSRLRAAKLPNPALIGNAGSFFKNPSIDSAGAGDLATKHPGLPVFGADAGRAKVSAAWLIESCGWKGFRDGDAGVSDQHALVLVNHGGASGEQILALGRRIAESVFERFGVILEPEPRIVGARW